MDGKHCLHSVPVGAGLLFSRLTGSAYLVRKVLASWVLFSFPSYALADHCPLFPGMLHDPLGKLLLLSCLNFFLFLQTLDLVLACLLPLCLPACLPASRPACLPWRRLTKWRRNNTGQKTEGQEA